MPSITRASIISGPARISFGGQTFWSKGDIQLNVINERFDIPTATFGKVVELGLEKLIPEDRQFILDHFGVKAAPLPGPNDPARSNTPPADPADLPYPLGEVSGPIESAAGSHYFIYLPKSLKKGRMAPVMHFNGAGGSGPGTIQGFLQGADRFGWIMVASVESRNDYPPDVNGKHAANNVAALKKLPIVDPDRIYFTGGSGGGAMSWYNCAKLHGAGTMPIIGYIPPTINISKGHHFIIGGALDFNRYHCGKAAAKFGKDAFYRPYPGGHDFPPGDSPVLTEGFAWLEGKFLQKNSSGTKFAQARLDYEAAMIDWIVEISDSSPHQAYHLCRMLTDTYKISGKNAALLGKLQKPLESDPKNLAYHEGLLAIHRFGVKEFGSFNLTTNGKGLNDDGHSRKAKSLAEKYAEIPAVEETFKQLSETSAR